MWIREYGGRLPAHIYPIGDIRDHITDGRHCWCNPKVDGEGDSKVITHQLVSASGQRPPQDDR